MSDKAELLLALANYRDPIAYRRLQGEKLTEREEKILDAANALLELLLPTVAPTITDIADALKVFSRLTNG